MPNFKENSHEKNHRFIIYYIRWSHASAWWEPTTNHEERHEVSMRNATKRDFETGRENLKSVVEGKVSV